jgi:hypothetical protein
MLPWEKRDPEGVPARGNRRRKSPMTALAYFISRIVGAVRAARAREAEFEVRRHLAMLPESSLTRAGFKATYKDANELPFVR